MSFVVIFYLKNHVNFEWTLTNAIVRFASIVQMPLVPIIISLHILRKVFLLYLHVQENSRYFMMIFWFFLFYNIKLYVLAMASKRVVDLDSLAFERPVGN